MVHAKKVTCAIVGCWLMCLCTPQPAVKTGTEEIHCPPVSEQLGDTTGYTISFSDKVRQSEFIESFRSFLDKYPFAELQNDTASGQIVIRLAPVTIGQNSGEALSSTLPAVYTGQSISSPWDADRVAGVTDSGKTVIDTGAQTVIDTVEPVIGGALRFFSQRAGIDETLLPLVAVDPFVKSDSGISPYLQIAAASPKKLSLQISGRVVDGGGKLISALDVIEAWTSYIKKHPAEGLALFRHVEGVREFIAGKEAVVRGFGATDQKTVFMKLTQADTLAKVRISNSRLCAGGYLKLGAYYADKSADGSMLLIPNIKTASRRANCDTLRVLSGDDRNPILSFSLKKYDAVPLISLADLSYARATLEKQAALWPLSRDRYFIACATDDEKVRGYLASRINPGELLKNVVKAEGVPLSAIESDGATVPEVSTADKAPAPVGRTVRILYRKDDPVSCPVAEKVLADLSGSGVRGVLVASAATEYERSLVDRNYDCAVGWVSDDVRTDPAERLSLASIWFADVTSEEERIASRREIPLFSIDRYLLMRRPAGLFRGAIAGVYTSARPIAKR